MQTQQKQRPEPVRFFPTSETRWQTVRAIHSIQHTRAAEKVNEGTLDEHDAAERLLESQEQILAATALAFGLEREQSDVFADRGALEFRLDESGGVVARLAGAVRVLKLEPFTED